MSCGSFILCFGSGMLCLEEVITILYLSSSVDHCIHKFTTIVRVKVDLRTLFSKQAKRLLSSYTAFPTKVVTIPALSGRPFVKAGKRILNDNGLIFTGYR